MTILGIETSCDETAAAIVTGNGDAVTLNAQTVASSLALHAQTGGIIPEQAAREQVKYMLPVIKETLKKTSYHLLGGRADSWKVALQNIDAIAVTYGPGLIGSLLVGVETAKTLAFVLNKPIIPVNHMVGHIYANFVSENPKSKILNPKLTPKPYTLNPAIAFPAIALVVSGGHTDLLLMRKHGDLQLLGGTRDDAAGEAYDKIGRMLGLSYPAGPVIEKLAKTGDPKRFCFPRPLFHENTYEFSFSGLKTAVLREAQKLGEELDDQTIADLARGTQDAIIDVLTKKTIRAAQEYKAKSILLSGGVAANQTLRDQFLVLSSQSSVKLFSPEKSLCTDNAAMIAAAAFFNNKPQAWDTITADPELYFD